MPKYQVTSPEGKSYEITAPDGASEADVMAYAQRSFKMSGSSSPPKNDELSWSDVPLKAISNIPNSAGNFLSGIYQAVRHPIDTASNLADMGAGAIRSALPGSFVSLIDRLDTRPEAKEVNKRIDSAASSAGKFISDRYGSGESIKNTLATDPVGVASDLSAILSGGAALAGRAPMIASGLRSAANATNPLTLPIKAISVAAPVVGNTVASLVGGLGTRTGAETIKQAFRSGVEGGESSKLFKENLRGDVPITDVLESAKDNIEAMGRAKSQAYREGMSQVSNDKTVLNFDGIDKAIAEAKNTVAFKGQVKNKKAAEVQRSIADAVDEWKNLDPAEFHTPEGLDALKQQIGGIIESIPFEEKTAGMIGKNIYGSIKDEIVKQAPDYSNTMKAYSEATDQIREIEKSLSLGKNASVDTAMRKLQSLTRNNVSTNYGNRLELAQQMEALGGNQITPALAGQALSSATPRGIGGAVAGGLGLGGYAVGGLPAALAALTLQSPRLMGEASFAAGKLTGKSGKIKDAYPKLFDKELANYLYQSGRLPQQ